MNLQHVGLVGCGEVGKIFSVGLQKQVANVRACDTPFDAEATTSTHAGCTPPCNVMIDVGVAHPGRALLRPDIDTGGFRSRWVVERMVAREVGPEGAQPRITP